MQFVFIGFRYAHGSQVMPLRHGTTGLSDAETRIFSHLLANILSRCLFGRSPDRSRIADA